MKKAPHIQTTVADPKLEIGPYRIFQRTDSLYIIYDARLPPARRTVGGETFCDIGDAVVRAHELLREAAE